MKKIFVLFLLIALSKWGNCQKVIFEIGHIKAAETTMLNSLNLTNSLIGFNLGLTYHHPLHKFDLEYKLSYSKLSQNAISEEIYDGVGIKTQEVVFTDNLPKIARFSLDVIGLLPIYKKNVFITFGVSLIATARHSGFVYSQNREYGGTAVKESFKYSYESKDEINSAIGVGSLMIWPITKKIGFTNRINLTIPFGESSFHVNKWSNLTFYSNSENTRLYICDFVTASLGIAYSLGK
jgi:hypothetical protein